MSTDVIYNGVEMHNVVTRQWEEEIVYDQSETDVIGHKYHLMFEGLLHAEKIASQFDSTLTPAWIAGTGGIASQTSAVSIEKELRRRLREPRQTLSVLIGDELILGVVPTTSQTRTLFDRDVSNGPHPKTVRITSVVGSKVFRIQFEIETTKLECTDSNSGGTIPLVINNRWSVAELTDENFYITRRINGRIRLSASNLSAGHSFKPLVVPSLEDGFKRDSVDFEITENGLDATYTIVDQQVHTSAPFPATDLSGRFSVSTADGVTYFSRIEVHLVGSPDADKRDLLTRAVQIADTRLNLLGATSANSFLITDAEISEDIGKLNIVDLSITTRDLSEPREFLTNLRTDTFGKPLELDALQSEGEDVEGSDYQPNKSRVPRIFGYDPGAGNRSPAFLFLLECYLQDPCSPVHGILGTQSGRLSTGESGPGENRSETSVTGTVVATIKERDSDLYTQDHKEAIYTLARIETTYWIDGKRVQIPIASESNDGATSVIVRLSAPQARREIKYEIERVGDWPQVPDSPQTYTDSSGEGTALVGTLLENNFTPLPPAPSPAADSLLHKLSGRMLYALNRPPTSTERLKTGVLPITDFNLNQTRLPPSVFDASLGP